jgi:hypothetical protein
LNQEQVFAAPDEAIDVHQLKNDGRNEEQG